MYFPAVAAESNKPEHGKTLSGHLLLADPALRDGVFDRGVVLLVEHSEAGGALGMILNRPTGKVVGDFLTVEKFAALRNIPVHQGGPVSIDQLSFCSFWWSAKSGLHCEARISAEEAIEQTHRHGRIVRAYIGYSGWTAGQLENELGRNAWITTPPGPDLLGKTHDEELWSAVMAEISPFHRILALAPADPFLN